MTPVQIAAAAKTAAVSATSVHVAGSIVRRGKPISLNMELVANKGGMGHVALEGVGFSIVGVDRAVFVSGGTAFFTNLAGATAARIMRGKWLKGAEAGVLAPFAWLTRMPTLLGSTLAAHGTLARGPATTVEGRPALAVSDGANGGTLYVASSGTPYPLELVERGASAGTLVFDRWNQPVELSVPANAINVKQLQSGR